MFSTIKYAQLFLFFSIANLTCFSQQHVTDSSIFFSASHLLKVTNAQKKVIRYFNENDVIIYRLKKYSTLKLRGTIEHIKKDSLIITGETIHINDFMYLASKAQKRENHLTSLMMIIAGGISTTSGIGLLVVGGTVAKFVGATSSLIGTPLLIRGATNYFRTNYLLPEEGWAIETVRLGGYPD